MIEKEQVKHIAKLARLEPTEKETEKIQKDLSAVLDYFEVLKKAPVSVETLVSKVEEIDVNNLRKDEAISGHNIADEIIGQAPSKKDNYFKVKQIL